MKKIFSLALALLMLLSFSMLLTSCGGADQVNIIGPMELTNDQSEIIGLISSDSNQYCFFEYALGAGYTRAEFWVEIYADGVLDKRLGGLSFLSDDTDDAGLSGGNLAISIDQVPFFRWTMTQSDNGVSSSISSEEEHADYAGVMARAYGPITSPVEIVPGKEIILHTTTFSNGPISSHGDQQIYVEQPELLQEYPYVHLIKCRFE